MHLAAQLMHSSWAPTISLCSHQNIGLHTGARANVVLLTYLHTWNRNLNDKTHLFSDFSQLEALSS